MDSQLALIDRSVEAALARRRLDNRAATRELRAFAQAYGSARQILASQEALSGAARPDATQIEAWLGAA
jgi:hypothetical protein